MQRVVRTRKNGWKKPFNTVFVSRPTKYSNPFKLEKGNIYGDASHRTGDQYPWVLIEPAPENIHARLVELYREWLAGNNPWDIIPVPFTDKDIMEELFNHDLACYCPLDRPCHADVLLEIMKKPHTHG